MDSTEEMPFHRKPANGYQFAWKHRVHQGIYRMFPPNRQPKDKVCPWVPRDLKEFTEHVDTMQAAIAEARKKHLDLQAKYAELDMPPCRMKLAFDGRVFDQEEFTGNLDFDPNPYDRLLGTVLAKPTIWQPYLGSFEFDVEDQLAPWPEGAEFAWEGDQRIATENGRFGRFFPLPRMDLPDITHQLRQRAHAYELDEVARMPDYYELYLGPHQVDQEDQEKLLNKDIIEAIDEDTIPVPISKLFRASEGNWRNVGSPEGAKYNTHLDVAINGPETPVSPERDMWDFSAQAMLNSSTPTTPTRR